MVAVWSIALALSVLFCTGIVSALLPRLFLRSCSARDVSCDRGIRRVKEPEGRSILYEPAPEQRKYVRQYILSERRGKKVIVCRIDESLSYLDYDVALFDRFDRAFKVLNVRELIERKGYTKEVELPAATSYAALTVNEADGERAGKESKRAARGGKLAAFWALSAVAITAEMFFVRFCCAYLFGGLFGESFFYAPEVTFFTCVLSAAAIAVHVIAYVCAAKLRGKKKSAGGET